MKDLLKEILDKLNSLEGKTDTGFTTVNERIRILDSSNKMDLYELNRKLDSISEVVAKTMEDITELKSSVEKQQVEIRVIKGGASNVT